MMKNKKKNTIKYGEFICSEFNWLPIEKQKEKANQLANNTKKENNKS